MPLNRGAGAYLQTFAAADHTDGDAFDRHFVVAQVEYDDAPQRLGKGLAKHPIPLMLLARLAIATSWQGKGLGSGLLKDAMLRTLQAADIAGIRAIAVHAKDDDARAFYERVGFMAAPTDPYHLFVLLKDVRAILK